MIATAVVAAGIGNASATVITDDFSTASPTWMYVSEPANVTIGVSGGKMVCDFAGIPEFGGLAPGIGGALYVDHPTTPFAPLTAEISSKIEIDGDSGYLYAGYIARGSADLGYDGQNITGHAYVLTISGYGDNGDFQINRIANGEQDGIGFTGFTGLGDLIDNNPLYMKMTVETLQNGDVEIKGKISLYPDFSDPFGEVVAIDSEASKIVVPGLVGMIAMNDDGEPCLPATAYFDDFYAADFIDTTVAGDCNGDGFVNSTDLDIVRGNWGQSVSGGASDGDLSGDGVVNSSDLDVVRGNWGATPGAAAVPEPAAFVLLVLGGLFACWKRR
jgi:hypothetical protein